MVLPLTEYTKQD